MKSIFKSNSLSDDQKMNQSLSLRINVFFFSTFIIFCIIIVRLAILQFVEGPTLKDEETSRDTKSVPLASIRGTIYAQAGEKLAYSTSVQTLYFTLTREYSETSTDKKTKKLPVLQRPSPRPAFLQLSLQLISQHMGPRYLKMKY